MAKPPTIWEIFTAPLFRRMPLITLQGLIFVCIMGFIAAITFNTHPF